MAVAPRRPAGRPPPWVLLQTVSGSSRHPKVVQGVFHAPARAEAVALVGMLPGALDLRQFGGSAVPALARPCRVLPVHEAKGLAVPAGTGQLGAHVTHNRRIFRELWGCQSRGRHGAGRGAIEVMLQAGRSGILVAVGHIVPELAVDKGREEPTEVVGPVDLGMLGGRQEGQTITVTPPDQPLGVGLLKEEEAVCILEILE